MEILIIIVSICIEFHLLHIKTDWGYMNFCTYTDCNIKLERKYVLYSEYYTNTVLTLETKESKAVQRIGDEPLKKEYNSPKSAQHPNVLGWKYMLNCLMIKSEYFLIQKIRRKLPEVEDKKAFTTMIVHAASKEYDYSGFGDQDILVIINPMHVLAVPEGEIGKLRTCR